MPRPSLGNPLSRPRGACRHRSSAILAIVWALVGPGCISALAGDQPVASKTERSVLLLTGFEPFGGRKINASWETTKSLNGKEIAGYRIVAVQLPVVYDEMDKPLQDAIKTHKPHLVISFGEGTPLPTIELIARNGYHPQQPRDNKRRPPPREKIIPNSAEQLPTTLPAQEIVAALNRAQIASKISRDAGGYLCNECFYRLMAAKIPADTPTPLLRGFVHLPLETWPDPSGKPYGIERLTEVVKIVAETTAQYAAKARTK